MAKYIRRQAILAKIETTYGTDSTPAAGDGVFVQNLQVNPVDSLVVTERQGIRASLASLRAAIGGSLYRVQFEVQIKGSGTADVPPEFGPLLRACALAESIVATTSVSYQPTSDVANHESVTIYRYHDGNLDRIVGCRGTMSITLPVQSHGMIAFDLLGVLDGRDTQALVTPTLDATVPPAFVNAAVAIGAFNPVINQLTMELANNFPPIKDANSTDGFAGVRVIERMVTGQIDPEDELIATNDFLNDLKTNQDFAFTTGVIGSAVGNQYELSMPAFHYRGMSEAERDGVMVATMNYGAVESAGDDDFTLTFT